MAPMPLEPGWSDFAIRLALATAAGTLIGLNRGESGNAAGLRTTLLVCLAACLAMMQVNVLLVQHGKPDDSFVTLDLMRLPLGILSGVGFIGAGSILHRNGLVQGVTTAATMWFVTVIGLCAGGGQYALALVGTVLGLVVLKTFSYAERWLPTRRRVTLTIARAPGTPAADALLAALAAALEPHGGRITARGLRREAGKAAEAGEPRVEERFEVRWRAKPDDDGVERALSRLVTEAGETAAWSVER